MIHFNLEMQEQLLKDNQVYCF